MSILHKSARRFALPSAGRAFGRRACPAKNAGGDGGTGAVGAIFASAGTGSGKPVCAQTKERVNRISFVRRRFDRVFPRAVEPPAFLCRREETASLPRTDHAFYTHRRTDCVSLMRRRTAVQKKRRAAGRSCGAALFSPGQTSFAFLPNSLRISGRSRRGARKQ